MVPTKSQGFCQYSSLSGKFQILILSPWLYETVKSSSQNLSLCAPAYKLSNASTEKVMWNTELIYLFLSRILNPSLSGYLANSKLQFLFPYAKTFPHILLAVDTSIFLFYLVYILLLLAAYASASASSRKVLQSFRFKSMHFLFFRTTVFLILVASLFLQCLHVNSKTFTQLF